MSVTPDSSAASSGLIRRPVQRSAMGSGGRRYAFSATLPWPSFRARKASSFPSSPVRYKKFRLV